MSSREFRMTRQSLVGLLMTSRRSLDKRPRQGLLVMLIMCLCSVFGVLAGPDWIHAAGDASNPSQAVDSAAVEFVEIEGYFSCEIPVGWTKISSYSGYGLTPEEKKVYGYELTKHMGETEPPLISVHYYAEDNLLYSSPELYIASKLPPVAQQVGSYRYGEVLDADVAGRPAKTFMRPFHRVLPPEPKLPDPSNDHNVDGRIYEHSEIMARVVPLIERYFVIPAGTGFFVLGYSAPEELFEEHLSDFEHVVATFSPLR